MKKDLILITAYVPDDRRQQMLRNLVYGINRNDFDIMISSHSFIPQDIFEKSDYVIYEQKNDIDFQVNNKFYFFFHDTNFSIISTEPKRYNHYVPVIRHISSGLIYAKSLGYENVHYFEYDSLIENDEELKENSKLLKKYSAVYYDPPHLSFPNSPISFNLNKISQRWFSLDRSNYEEFLRKPTSTKLVEEYEWILLNEGESLFKKQTLDLKSKNIHIALNHDLEDNKWIVPVYDPSNKSLFIFSWVESDEDVNSEVIIILNGERAIKINRSFKSLWSIHNLGGVNEVKEIKIIVNNQIRREYNFNKESIDDFIKHNYIKRK